jgi:translation initiation factor IF-1
MLAVGDPMTVGTVGYLLQHMDITHKYKCIVEG